MSMTPRVYTLFAGAITTVLSAHPQSAIVDLDGMASANILAEMIGGTGGTSIDAYVETSFDDGSTWLHVARFTWATTASKKFCVLQTNAAKGVTSYAALGAEGVNDGLLGAQLRVTLTTVGVYSNTTLAIRVHVH